MITLASQAISLTGASKTLTIRGVRTKLSAADGIKINTSSAKLSLQAMNLYLCSPGMTFDTGNLEFADDVQVSGGSQTSPTTTVSLTFSSSGIATILSASRLKLNPDIKFVYSPNTALDGGVASVQKRHFKMTDPSSTLQLQHAYIDVGSTGMALDYGKFIIEELANITTTTTAGKEFELGSTVNTMILSAGVLQINGLIKYVPSTYP